MSILNLLFGSNTNDDDLPYSDTNEDGDQDAYMYRLERDGNYTPVSKDEYDEETKDDWKNGYYDDPIFNSDDDDDEPKKGWFGLW